MRVAQKREGERLIADLSVVAPAAALARRHVPGKWQVVDYELEGVKGKLIGACPETGAPAVRLPLGVDGWHAVYVGLWCPGWGDPAAIRLRLGSDARFVRCVPDRNDFLIVQERFWKCAKLAPGEILEIAQQPRGTPRPAGLAFIRLVPLSDEEVRRLEADRAESGRRRLFALNDAFTAFWEQNVVTAGEVEEWIEPYRDTDFHRLCWELGNIGKAMYPSRVTRMFGDGQQDFPRVGDRYVAESMRALAAAGVDVRKLACDYAHGLGLEFYVSLRMGAWSCCAPFDEVFGWPEMKKYTRWRCLDRGGKPIERLSYAYDGVHELVLEFLREGIDCGADGMNLLFIRGMPYTLYDEPVVKSFIEKYGDDPRQISEYDERWIMHRCEPLTRFMRRLRRESSAWDRSTSGKPLGICAYIFHNRMEDIGYGIDLETWIREGLVDSIVSHSYPSTANDFDYYGRLCRGTKVRWYADLGSWGSQYDKLISEAQRAYKAGAYGLAIWDTNLHEDAYWGKWPLIRRFGHRDEVDRMSAADAGAVDHKLLTLNGYRVDLWSPNSQY